MEPTVTGCTARRAALPWGSSRPHVLADLMGQAGDRAVASLAEFVVVNGFSAVLAPAHFLAESSGEKFDFGRLTRKRKEKQGFTPQARVYIPGLGVLLPRDQATRFFDSRSHIASYACRNTTCCRRGARDMLSNPRRHFVLTRTEEVRSIYRVPAPQRPEEYLNSILRPATDRLGIDEEVSEAMSTALTARLDAVQKRAGITAREVAQLLNTTPETVSRWRAGKTQPQPDRRDVLLRLEWLVTELSDLYSPDEAKLWLFSPHRLLAGDRPADRIQQGKIEDVLTIIDQLKSGAYA